MSDIPENIQPLEQPAAPSMPVALANEVIEVLPLEAIIPGTRLRQDYGDIPGMMASLRQYGQLQPIGVDHSNRIIFGGRRYFSLVALKECGELDKQGKPFTHIRIVRRECLNEMDLREMELEENLQRKEMTWQEKTMGILEIHQLKCKHSALQGTQWTNAMTSMIVGVNRQRVDQVLPVARMMQSDVNSPLWTCPDFNAATRMMLDLRAEAGKRLLARSLTAGGSAAKGITLSANTQITPSSAGGLLSGLGTSAHLAPGALQIPSLDHASAGHQSMQVEKVRINLADIVHLGDCREHMRQCGEGVVDHIITDPPYGIDMSMLQQDGTGMDVSQTVNEHGVEENEKLLAEFIFLAYKCLRPKGFLVMFCDEMRFKWLYDLGIAAGFAVQRWSAVWCKAQAMNQAAGYNFTKATENAIIMRKQGAVLAAHQPLNWKMITKTAEDKLFDHPFAKPFELWKWMVEAVSQPGQEIWDTFAGSHSGPCAMIKLGRKVQSWERAEQHLYEGLTKMTQVYKEYFKGVKGVEVEAFYEPNQNK